MYQVRANELFSLFIVSECMESVVFLHEKTPLSYENGVMI